MELSAKISIPRGTQFREIREQMDRAGVPENATVSVHVTRADRPWESDQAELQFRWETQ